MDCAEILGLGKPGVYRFPGCASLVIFSKLSGLGPVCLMDDKTIPVYYWHGDGVLDPSVEAIPTFTHGVLSVEIRPKGTDYNDLTPGLWQNETHTVYIPPRSGYNGAGPATYNLYMNRTQYVTEDSKVVITLFKVPEGFSGTGFRQLHSKPAIVTVQRDQSCKLEF